MKPYLYYMFVTNSVKNDSNPGRKLTTVSPLLTRRNVYKHGDWLFSKRSLSYKELRLKSCFCFSTGRLLHYVI